MIALLARYGSSALAVVLAGWLFVACQQRDSALVAKGHAEEQAAQMQRTIAGLQHRSDSVAVLVQHDTATVTRWRTKYDTARVTVNVHDTVSVIRFLATADSTVTSCRETVAHLVSACALKDTIIAALRARPRVPANDRRFSLSVTAGYGATLANGSIHTGPSVTVGGSLRLY